MRLLCYEINIKHNNQIFQPEKFNKGMKIDLKFILFFFLFYIFLVNQTNKIFIYFL
jgi:hypothetical protein